MEERKFKEMKIPNGITVKYELFPFEKPLDEEFLDSLGYKKVTTRYYVADAPGKIPYWTDVVIDYRFKPELRIRGFRPYPDGEEGMLFEGVAYDREDFLSICRLIKLM